MRSVILAIVVAVVVSGIGACATVVFVMCREFDGSCGAPGQRAAAWVRKEVRVGMDVPQLLKLAESAPFDTWWTVSLEDCSAVTTHSFYVQPGASGYVGVTIARGSFDRVEQQFRTRDDLLAAMPYHLRCGRAEVHYPHWRVPVALDSRARVTQVFDLIWND